MADELAACAMQQCGLARAASSTIVDAARDTAATVRALDDQCASGAS
jgi:hypothetical protein